MTIGLSAGFSVIRRPAFWRQRHGRPAPFRGDVDDIGLCHYPFGYGRRQPFYALILRVMNISGILYDDAYHYMIIIVLGLVAMMAYNLLSSICRALGDSRTPLYFLIVSSLLNIALALLFIVVFGWGVPGSAIAWSSPRAYRRSCALPLCASVFPCCA